MSYLNRWLFYLSIALSIIGFIRSNDLAVAIGALSAFCALLAHLITPKRRPNNASRIIFSASQLWGWGLVLFMVAVVLYMAIGDSLLIPTIDIAWRVRRIDLLPEWPRLR